MKISFTIFKNNKPSDEVTASVCFLSDNLKVFLFIQIILLEIGFSRYLGELQGVISVVLMFSLMCR